MKVVLMEKKMAVASPVKELVISGTFTDYYSSSKGVNESLLIKNLPKDFLPKPAKSISVWVEMDNGLGSKGQDSSEGLFSDAETWNTFRVLLCR